MRRVVSAVPRRCLNSFKSREQASEQKAIQEHEKQLLEKLKAKLRAEKGPESLHHVEVIEKLQNSIKELKLPENVVQEAKKDPLTTEDFLSLRKELLSRVRDLEDELARLRVEKKQ